MKPEGSLPCSQEPSTEPDQSNPYHPILSKIHFNIVHPSTSWPSQSFFPPASTNYRNHIWLTFSNRNNNEGEFSIKRIQNCTKKKNIMWYYRVYTCILNSTNEFREKCMICTYIFHNSHFNFDTTPTPSLKIYFTSKIFSTNHMNIRIVHRHCESQLKYYF
jgi:hypothetical protein